MTDQLGDLAAFVSVARAGGFREAARNNSISASGLSEAVRRLEEQLGVRLLETRDASGSAAYPVAPGDLLFYTSVGTSYGGKNLKNSVVVINAKTTEITGDGQKVNGLAYDDRATGEAHRVELEGVFVQIGLVPNTEWLKGTVELSRHGEIIVDAKGQTSIPGVFAAGDATTVPFKQIIIAAGDGAKAALGAFDYLVRH